ncbi:MAG: hypothetical protein IJZ35_06505 [Clostridia bacterium]|nr:hypothetical protein [Clostridia bacterium]
MKKIISFILCITLIFAASMCVSAKYEEFSSDDKDVAIPQWQVINTINITFYITDGKAYISYLVTADTDNIEVSVQLQRQTLFWFDVGDEKTEKSGDKKYISGSYTVPVDSSGEYRVRLTVKAQDETKTKTAEFSYDENLLMGDANSDGFIKANDARLILRYAAQLEIFTQSQKNKCDMNIDGSITAADARTVLRMSAQLI